MIRNSISAPKLSMQDSVEVELDFLARRCHQSCYTSFFLLNYISSIFKKKNKQIFFSLQYYIFFLLSFLIYLFYSLNQPWVNISFAFYNTRFLAKFIKVLLRNLISRAFSLYLSYFSLKRNNIGKVVCAALFE